MLFRELNGVVQTWLRKVLKEAERDITAGGLLNTPYLPNRATSLIQTAMCQALAQGYWLQHLYMRECESAVKGEKYRGKVTLADIPSDDELRKVLEKFINSQRAETSKEWHTVIPQEALNWVRWYTPKLAGVLEKDVLENVRNVMTISLREGAPLALRMKYLRSWEPKIAAMAERRVEAIARTEITRADTMGRLIAMRGNPDVLGVEFSAVLDSRTTDICEERHGLVMRFDDPRLPYNTPPLHVNCRSILLPATVYEYPDGLLTSHEFEDVPVSVQRPEDIEEIEKLLTTLQLQAEEEQRRIQETRAAEATKEAEWKQLNIPQAKTIREANEIAVQYGLAENANFKGLDVGAANELIIGVARAKEMFPELEMFAFVGSLQEHYALEKELEIQRIWDEEQERLRRLNPGVSDDDLLAALKRRIRKRSAPQNNLAMAFSRNKLKGISLNANKFSPQTLAFTQKRLLPRSVESNFHPSGCDTIKSVIDHEMGHQIDYLLDASHDPQIQALYNALTMQGKEAMCKALSYYANENIREFIAEAWSEYMNNPEPRSTAREVAERLLALRREKFRQ